MKITKSQKLKILLLSSLLIYYKRLKQRLKYTNKKWQNRRCLVRPINQQRKQYGEYDNLFQHLIKDMFFKYTRMFIQHFNKLSAMLTSYLKKKIKKALSLEQEVL